MIGAVPPVREARCRGRSPRRAIGIAELPAAISRVVRSPNAATAIVRAANTAAASPKLATSASAKGAVEAAVASGDRIRLTEVLASR